MQNYLYMRAVCTLLCSTMLAYLQVETLADDAVKGLEYGAPRALIVAYKDYPNFNGPQKQLQHTLPSAALLAGELAANGYSVTVITQSSSQDDARRLLTQKADVNVEMVENSPELLERINQWGKDHFDEKPDLLANERAPFGMMLFSGHGEMRGGEDVFLTPEDMPGEGGVNLHEIRKAGGDRRFPVILIVDACRQSVDRAADKAPAKPVWPSLSEENLKALVGERVRSAPSMRLSNRGQLIERPRELALTLFAVQPNEACPDLEWNLTRGLADGLTHVESPKSFLARRDTKLSSKRLSPFARDEDLFLLAWFKHAKNRLGAGEDDNTQSPDLQRGWIDQGMIIASRSKEFHFSPPPIDLLPEWNLESFPPNTALNVKSQLNGITISRRRPAAGTANPIAVGFFSGKYTLQKQSLVIELLTSKPMEICLGVGNYANGTPYSNEYDKRRMIPANRPHREVIPLRQAPSEQSELSLAVFAHDEKPDGWPDNHTLLITNMTLLSNDSDRPNPSPKKPTTEIIDLVPYWWASDPLPYSCGKFLDGRVRFDGTKLAATIRGIGKPADAPLGWGGPLVPDVLIEKSHTLSLVVDDFQPLEQSKCEFSILIEARDAVTGKPITIASKTMTITRKQLGKAISIPVEASGLAEYMGIQAGANQIKIGSVRLKPR